jgi:hypothetical protein
LEGDGRKVPKLSPFSRVFLLEALEAAAIPNLMKKKLKLDIIRKRGKGRLSF